MSRIWQSRMWIPVLIGLAAAAPFLDGLTCAPFALTADFWIPSQRPYCRWGSILSLALLALAGVFLARGSASPHGVLQDAMPRNTRERWVSLLSAGFGALMFCLYLFSFTVSAHHALLSADQDVTNVSTAIERTHLNDILPTPYVAAGFSRSFLAHHFSPSLLLYVPFYRLIGLFDVDHNIYNYALALTVAVGLVLWLYYAFRSSRETFLLPLFLVPFTHTFLLLRQVVSSHFEVLTLPLFALLLLSIRLRGRTDLPVRAKWLANSWLLIACLYLGIKEDMGVYLALYSGIFFLGDIADALIKPAASTLDIGSPTPMDAGRILSAFRLAVKHSVYLRLAILSVVWLLAAMTLRLWIAGEGAPGWESYWNAANFPPFRKTPYTYALVLLSSGLWVFFSARSTIVVVCILSLHLVSGMPWHALLESHYSYTILPFLLAGSVRGFSNLKQWDATGRLSHRMTIGLVIGGAMLADYAMLRERNHPFPMLIPHPAFQAIRKDLQMIPEGACVQSSFHLSALVPLHSRPLPFTYYARSPWESILPGVCRLKEMDPSRWAGECRGMYRLLLEAPVGCMKAEMEESGGYIGSETGKPLLWRLTDQN